MATMIKCLALIGTGLIGGSLALGLKKTSFCSEVIGYGRHKENLKYAVEKGVLDNYASSIEETISNADVIVIAVPMGVVESVLQKVHVTAPAKAIITDVGSTKGSFVDLARKIMPERLPYVVPAHPIAGKEHSGVQYAESSLFEGHYTIVTPLLETLPESLKLVMTMWEQLGSTVVSMDVSHHDKVLAATSHLPHMLAYLLVDTLAQMESQGEVFKYAAGGFNDFTRIASSSPEMWRDICLHNRDAIIDMLHRYRSEMDGLIHIMEACDSEGLAHLFTRAKQRRDELIQNDAKS